MKTGEILKKDLGLSKFKYIVIQKVITLPITMYIITINSRFPTVYIPYSRIRTLKSITLQRIKFMHSITGSHIVKKSLLFSPPIPIEDFDRSLNTNDVILIRDLAGEYYKNMKYYEKIIKIKRSTKNDSIV